MHCMSVRPSRRDGFRAKQFLLFRILIFICSLGSFHNSMVIGSNWNEIKYIPGLPLVSYWISFSLIGGKYVLLHGRKPCWEHFPCEEHHRLRPRIHESEAPVHDHKIILPHIPSVGPIASFNSFCRMVQLISLFSKNSHDGICSLQLTSPCILVMSWWSFYENPLTPSFVITVNLYPNLWPIFAKF